MRSIQTTNFSDRRFEILLPAMVLMFVTLLIGLIYLTFEGDVGKPLQHLTVLPWIALTAISIIIPNLILYFKGEFKFYNPIVFASLTYFFPAFVVGGIFLISGMSNPYFLVFIQDFDADISLTLWYVTIGFTGLSIGFLTPFGKLIGNYLETKLPIADWNPQNVVSPTLFLMGIGIANSFFAFTLGLIGFQKVAEIGEYDGIIYIITMFSTIGFFLLWLTIFKLPKLSFNIWLVAGLLTFITLVKALFAGNRGSLLSSFIVIAIAFAFSGRTISRKQKILSGVLLFVFVIGGMIYGTTFRGIKESEAQSNVGDYISNIEKTIDSIGNQNMITVLEQGVMALAERVDAVSPLAVVVSNYERLAPYEESYGLDNNIIKDTLTFFIPRAIWAEKPVASEPRKYGELYFSYGENSFTVTPIGDLLRNFGWIGIPIGMLFLGILLRAIYVSLIENKTFSLWRITFYFMLLTSVSYEGFYGGILPFLVKVGFTTIIGLLIINFFTKKNKINNVRI